MSSSNFTDSTQTLTGDLAAVRSATDTVSPREAVDAATAEGDAYERRIDTDALSDEHQRALEADDFVLYGKASISQYDKGNPKKGQPPQKLEMGALEGALDQYFNEGREGGPVSYGHEDVIVGDVIPSYQLDEPTQIDVDDETLSFDAGDTLETHVDESADSMWVVANLDNATYFDRKMRLLTMAGALDGFSVTVVPREWEETDDGQHVTVLDWHSTTIGTGEQILNPGSEFGVAAFKAAMSDVADGMAATFRQSLGDSDAAGGAAETPGGTHDYTADIKHKLTMGLLDNLFSESGIDPQLGRAVSDASQKAQTHDLSQKEAVTLTVNSDEFGDDEDVTEERVLNAMDDVDAEVDSSDEDDDGSDDGSEDDADADSTEDGDGVGSEVSEHAGGDGGDGDSGQDDAHDAAARLANAIPGADASDVMAKVGELDGDGDESSQSADDEDEEDDDDDDDDDGEDEDDDVEQKSDGEYVTEEELDSKLDGLRGDIVDDLAPKLEDAVNESIEDFGQKMASGGTSDPAGGAAETGRDLDSELDRIADEKPGREA